MSAYADYLERNGFMDHQQFGIRLNVEGTRRVEVKAPLVLSPADLDRIRGWLGVQFIIQQPLTPGEVNFGDLIGA